MVKRRVLHGISVLDGWDGILKPFSKAGMGFKAFIHSLRPATCLHFYLPFTMYDSSVTYYTPVHLSPLPLRLASVCAIMFKH